MNVNGVDDQSGRWSMALAERRLGRRARAGLDMPEGHATLGQVIRRHLQRDAVARENADAVLAHFSAGVGDELMAVFKRDAITRVGQHFVDLALHFDEFFFGHSSPWVGGKQTQPLGSIRFS